MQTNEPRTRFIRIRGLARPVTGRKSSPRSSEAFPRWSRVGVELHGPRLISRSAKDAVLEDEYTLRIVAGGHVQPSDSGRERYTVRCSADGRWAIARNDDYLP